MTLPRLHRAVLTATAASTLLLTAACGSDDDPAAADPTTSATEPAPAGDDPADADAAFADGDYEASGSYSNPGGSSSVTVELTLTGGTISEIEVTPEASGTSRQFQNKFVSGIRSEVVGKKISEINVSKVAGSSLTSGGFNQAIETIKADARR